MTGRRVGALVPLAALAACDVRGMLEPAPLAFASAAVTTVRDTDFALGDLDGDGRADLVFTTSDHVVVRRLLPDSRVEAPVLYPTPRPLFPDLADLDGDGALDLFGAADPGYPGATILALRGDGHAGFGPPVTLSSDGCLGTVGGIAAAPVFGTGLDLVGVDEVHHMLFVVARTGPLAYGACTPRLLGADPREPLAVDLDGRGRPSLLALSLGENLLGVIAPVDGNGLLPEPISYVAPAQPMAMTSADLDGSGQVEVLTAHRGGQVARWRPFSDGMHRGDPDLLLPAAGRTLVAADLDGDGRSEAAVGLDDGTVVVLGLVGGALAVRATVSVGGPVKQLRAGDLDGDGHTDLVALDVPNGAATSELTLLFNRTR